MFSSTSSISVEFLFTVTRVSVEIYELGQHTSQSVWSTAQYKREDTHPTLARRYLILL
jgi:hypothetical protein